MVRRLLSSLLFAALALTVYADPPAEGEVPAFEAWPKSLGFYGSMLAGNGGAGLHFQRWIGNIGYQVTAGGVYQPNSGYDTLDYSVFGEILYRVFGDDFSSWFCGQLYLWGLAGHRGFLGGTYDTETDSYSQGSYEASFLAGVGIGIEPIFFKHFSVPLQFGYVGEFGAGTVITTSFGGGFRYRY